MSDQELISLLTGILMPLLIAAVMQRAWPDWLRMSITYAVVFIVSLFSAWFLETLELGSMEPRTVVRQFLIIAASSHAAFKALWQPTGVTTAIEAKTSTPEAPPHIDDPVPPGQFLTIRASREKPYRLIVNGQEYVRVDQVEP